MVLAFITRYVLILSCVCVCVDEETLVMEELNVLCQGRLFICDWITDTSDNISCCKG